MQRIQEAGRHRPPVLLHALYHDHWRYLEPYSYRYRARDKPWIPLFYAYCHKDNQIEAFSLSKIQDLRVTETPFRPKWTVEV
jgi:hypothetical protein